MAEKDKTEKGKKDGGKPGKGAPQAEAKGGKPAKAAKGGGEPGEAKAAEAKPKAEKGPARPVPPPRLKKHYAEKVAPELMKRFGYKNPMEAPRIVKIVVNMGVGEAIQNAKLLDAAAGDLAIITGQKPAIRRAKKSIANFKLRQGVPIGCVVTLRRARMWEFYDRLVNIAIPRIRDFRGVPTRSFDGRGNYTLGLTEQIIFPEINYDRVEKVRGMDVTIVTTARTDEEGRELLRLMQLPFRQAPAQAGQAQSGKAAAREALEAAIAADAAGAPGA
jgi:large subunit ribosomal protein L5